MTGSKDEAPTSLSVGAVDDATGTVPAALFRRQEDAHGYLLLHKETEQPTTP